MSDVLMELVKDKVDKKVDEGKQEMTADHIKDIMDSFGVTIDKAMESLKIPPNEWDTYAGLVKKNM